jgi:phage shock protein A
MLDEATAMGELNAEPIDKAKALEEKYASKSTFSVDEELKQIKSELGI